MREWEKRLADECAQAGVEAWLRKTDPADDSEVARVAATAAKAIPLAMQTARQAQAEWVRVAPADRAAMLDAAADSVAAAADDLAWLITREMGKPLADARGGVDAGVGTLRQYAQLGPLHRGRALAGGWDAADMMIWEPRGVVAAITPWNDPVAVSCGLLGAALVTGNSVLYKPSERTPATGWLLHQQMASAFPPGVLTLLSGGPDIGAARVAQPVDVVAHVGSTATGRAIRRAVADTGAKALLENGGNDPILIDENVDPRWAAEQVALGAFANAGQICVSVERIYVHQRIASAFLTELVRLARELRMGPGLDPGTQLGPLVDDRLRQAVHGQVRAAVAAGAELLCGGEIPAGPGSFYPATVLSGCVRPMAVMREETFGPVAPVSIVDSFDAGLKEASESGYGLSATVLTSSMQHAQRAWRELPAGTVKVNAVFGGAPGGAAHPRKASGSGYGYGPELLDEFCATKVVHIASARSPEPHFAPADHGERR